jgi:hypothetical protein
MVLFKTAQSDLKIQKQKTWERMRFWLSSKVSAWQAPGPECKVKYHPKQRRKKRREKQDMERLRHCHRGDQGDARTENPVIPCIESWNRKKGHYWKN